MVRTGTVLLIRWPRSDQAGWKVRPCVVVSSDSYNAMGSDVIVAAISSRRRFEAQDIWLPASDKRFASTGLRRSSTIRCGKLYTYDLRGAPRALGALAPDLLREVLTNVKEAIAEPPDAGSTTGADASR
ncbi:MAG: type II toxin-antitoxin system PemK/MazF family toxin [Planctomycetes bacterium]|nr:type II toxin-antitoxin system PemK/MazF family toxin [Planctomycetota bacterium]